MTLFKKQNRITVVNHAVRDMYPTDLLVKSPTKQISTMVNLGIVFQEPLTRPGIKLDEKMSICYSIPQDHTAYTNSNQSSIGFDYFFFFCGESSIVVNYRT